MKPGEPCPDCGVAPWESGSVNGGWLMDHLTSCPVAKKHREEREEKTRAELAALRAKVRELEGENERIRSQVGACHCNKREPEFGPPCSGAAECERGMRKEAQAMFEGACKDIAALQRKVERGEALAKAIDRHHGHNLDGDEIGCAICEAWRAWRTP